MAKEITSCPCGTSKPYQACCGAIHQGEVAAQTAEQLMRSRYSAFALGLEEYLKYSWHPDTCPVDLDLDRSCKWLGLKVKQTSAGGAHDAEGTVTFIARYRQTGKGHRLEEKSRFVRLASDGRWVYHSALND